MNIYTKSGDTLSDKGQYGFLKEREVLFGLENYTHHYRVLNLNWEEIPVKLVSTKMDTRHPLTSEKLNLVFQNIDKASEDFGVEYYAEVGGWQLHKIKFIFEEHPVQFLASPVFQIIFLLVVMLLFT